MCYCANKNYYYSAMACGPGLPRNCTAQHNHSASGENQHKVGEKQCIQFFGEIEKECSVKGSSHERLNMSEPHPCTINMQFLMTFHHHHHHSAQYSISAIWSKGNLEQELEQELTLMANSSKAELLIFISFPGCNDSACLVHKRRR